MTETLIFGSVEPNVDYTERRAAYLVIIDGDTVAMVRSRGKLFLPGGGSLPGEAPEETISREVHEELARGVRLLRGLGEAIQYFHSTDDDRRYKMTATFFAGEFEGETLEGVGEHELEWTAIASAERACFHECQAWAIRQARPGFG
jgi:8-oxo-dGTP diphosphatase